MLKIGVKHVHLPAPPSTAAHGTITLVNMLVKTVLNVR